MDFFRPVESSLNNLWPKFVAGSLDKIRIRVGESCNWLQSQLLKIYHFVTNIYIGLSNFLYLS